VIPATVGVCQRDHVAQPQPVQPGGFERRAVLGLDVQRAAFAGQASARSNQMRRHDPDDRHAQLARGVGRDLEILQKVRRAAFELHVRVVRQLEADAVGAHDDLVADRHLFAHGFGEMDDHMLREAARFPGDDAARALRRAGHHHSRVAHAGQDIQAAIAPVVLQRDAHAGMNAVGQPAVGRIAHGHVVDDATIGGQQERPALGIQPVRFGGQPGEPRRRDLPHHRDTHQTVGVRSDAHDSSRRLR